MNNGGNGAFIETKQFHRFKEFCDACRKYKYIGVCYGVPGIGKTLSARHYANWDNVASFKASHSSHLRNLSSILDSTVALYTATVVNSAGHVAREIETQRKLLRDIRIADLSRQQDESLEEIRRCETAEKDALSVDKNHSYSMIQEVASAAGDSMRHIHKQFWDKKQATPDPTDLIIIDETDRLRMTELEQLRAIFDEGGTGMVMIGMPGLEKRLARYAQLYSRIGFVHEFKPLAQEDVRQLLREGWAPAGVPLPTQRMIDEEAVAALVRIAEGKFRLLSRLFQQIGRVMEINGLDKVTREVVDAARESLVIGTG